MLQRKYLKQTTQDEIFSLLKEISREKTVSRLINVSDMIHYMLAKQETIDAIKENFISNYSHPGYAAIYDMCFYYRVLTRFMRKSRDREYAFLFEFDIDINKYEKLVSLFSRAAPCVGKLIDLDVRKMNGPYDFHYIACGLRDFLEKTKYKRQRGEQA